MATEYQAKRILLTLDHLLADHRQAIILQVSSELEVLRKKILDHPDWDGDHVHQALCMVDDCINKILGHGVENK